MTRDDIATLLAIMAGAYLLTALIGKLTGDAVRDVHLVAGLGVTLGGLAAALMVV